LRGPVATRLAAVLGLWLAVAVIYWPSSEALSGVWRGPGEFDHGYLILLVSLWLVVRARARLAAVPVGPAAGALALTLGLSVAWLWFWRAAIQDLHLLLMPVILLVAIAAALGWRISRELLFPAGYLYLAMPAWAQAAGFLQALSAKANGGLIWLTGVPAIMQGDSIRLPAGTLRIEGGCSGLHTLLVGLALAALYGELARESLRRRLIWLGLMTVISLVTNWIRIFVVMLVAYESDMRSPLVKHHVWLGLLLFGFAVAGFLWLAGRLGGSKDRRLPAEIRPQEATRAASAQGQGAGLARAAATVACLGILPALAYGADLSLSQRRTPITVAWPAVPADWRGPQPILSSEWAPIFLRPSVEQMQRYVDARGQPVDVLVVAYRTQTQRAKLLGYWNSTLGSGELPQPGSDHIVDTAAGRWRETLVVDAGGTRSLIWWHYRIGGQVFVRALRAQLWYGLTALAAHPVSSLTALRVVCSPDCSAAHRQLSAEAAGLEPAVRL
jgi:EpsI family protein